MTTATSTVINIDQGQTTMQAICNGNYGDSEGWTVMQDNTSVMK
jgi:hypothetical protein